MTTDLAKFSLVCVLISGVWALTGHSSPANDTQADSEFVPIKEAELPDGFPPYTPVGRIEVKHYPAARKAVADGVGRFWSLFRHINQHNVAMTAPVEMQFGSPQQPLGREQSMAFFYERPDQGVPGAFRRVVVSDEEPITVVSIGCRGRRSSETVETARKQLLQWIREHSDRYETAGPLRVMGYNSPFVPTSKQFYEVQIPIREKGANREAQPSR